MKTNNKIIARKNRRWRIRKTVIGTAEKPRLSIFCSLKHIYAQLTDDLNAKTLMTCGTLSKDLKSRVPSLKSNVKSATVLGELIAEKALAKGLKNVVFDRSGYKFHGKVKAFADAARGKGLVF